MTTVRTNKDGRMETVKDGPGVVTQADVDRTRRELRDMLAGNTQFHVEVGTVVPPAKDPLHSVVDRVNSDAEPACYIDATDGRYEKRYYRQRIVNGVTVYETSDTPDFRDLRDWP